MSLTPAYLFSGKTDCCGCGKAMGVNDRGIYYNVTTRTPRNSIQDLMFCVPCAWRVSHAMVADLAGLKNDETVYSYVTRAPNGGRTFSKVYADVVNAIDNWADIDDEVKGITQNALQKP